MDGKGKRIVSSQDACADPAPPGTTAHRHDAPGPTSSTAATSSGFATQLALLSAVEECLRRADWLPAAVGLEVPQGTLPEGTVLQGGDLLPALIAAWESAARAPGLPSRRRALWRLNRLQQHAAAGACLTWSFPQVAGEVAAEWLGPRLTWWPRGVPAGRRVGFVSSHLGRRLDRQGTWFRAFRAACVKLDPREEIIVAGAGTTTDAFVQRAAALFGVPVLRITAPCTDEQASAWCDRVLRATRTDDDCWQADVSPLLPGGADQWSDLEGSNLQASEWLATPLRDRAVVGLCERLVVLRLRAGGRLEPLLHRRLADSAWPTHSMVLALDPELVARPVADRLLELGAVGWVLLGATTADRDEPAVVDNRPVVAPCETDVSRDVACAPLIECPRGEPWRFLTHCTRDQAGPWPDQSDEAYRDELLLHATGVDHSAVAALRRILQEGRIIATAAAIRGGFPVVSFTAAPLEELAALRVFRGHRSRWDFEPYGVCIDRQWLVRRGARPVIYGDETTWELLSREERPFFQQRWSRSPTTAREIDWSREREWRFPADVPLHDVPSPAGLVFVPTRAEAQSLQPFSRWPIVTIADD